MNFQDDGRTLPDNVVAFPGVRRTRPQHWSLAHEPVRSAPHRRATVMGGELNARLMVLLGICVTGAAAVVSAAHFLQG
jgi:hypothetical protein